VKPYNLDHHFKLCVLVIIGERGEASAGRAADSFTSILHSYIYIYRIMILLIEKINNLMCSFAAARNISALSLNAHLYALRGRTVYIYVVCIQVTMCNWTKTRFFLF
jgi:hypothetical protein